MIQLPNICQNQGATHTERQSAPPQVRFCEKRGGKLLSLTQKKKRSIDKIAGLCPLLLKAQSVPKSGLQVGTEDYTRANLGKGA